MKKALTLLVATASLTKGFALVINGQYMIRSSERVALGITIASQAIGRNIKVLVDESQAKTQSGLTFVDIDPSQITDGTAQRLEIVRAHQSALRVQQNVQAEEQPANNTPDTKPTADAASAEVKNPDTKGDNSTKAEAPATTEETVSA